jgi:hypothetical protein
LQPWSVVEFVGRGNCIVNRLYSAYIAAVFATHNKNGSRSMQIERLGAIEMRLIEFTETQPARELGIWIELYNHDFQSSFDAFAAKVSTRQSCFSSNLYVRRNA